MRIPPGMLLRHEHATSLVVLLCVAVGCEQQDQSPSGPKRPAAARQDAGFEASDSSDPVPVDEPDTGLDSTEHDLDVRDMFIFEADYTSGIRVFDADDPQGTRAARAEPLPPQLMEVARIIDERRFAAARDLARRYAGTHPDDGRGIFMIGLTYHKAGNHGPALPYFERGLELSPDYYVTHHYLGECLFMLGEMQGARREYEAYLEADPNEPGAHYGLGLVDLEAGELAEAEVRFGRVIELFERMKQVDPQQFGARQSNLARCHARLADVHFARDEYESARDELIASTTIDPRNISALYALSLVHRRLGQDIAADETLRRYETAREAIIRSWGSSGG